MWGADPRNAYLAMMRMTRLDRQRADALAARLGYRSGMSLVVRVLLDQIMEAEMEADARTELEQLRRALGVPASQRCRSCGETINLAVDALEGNADPGAGDLSVCSNCGVLSIYTGDGFTVRAPTEAEQLELQTELDWCKRCGRAFMTADGAWASPKAGVAGCEHETIDGRR